MARFFQTTLQLQLELLSAKDPRPRDLNPILLWDGVCVGQEGKKKTKKPHTTSTVVLLKKMSLQSAAAFAHGLVLLNIHGFEKHTTEHTPTH